jgi:hypothetical protein
VSEPLGDLAGAWNEVPESSYGILHHGHDELHPFRPRSMPAAVEWSSAPRCGQAHAGRLPPTPEMAGSGAAGWRISPDGLLYPVRAKF